VGGPARGAPAPPRGEGGSYMKTGPFAGEVLRRIPAGRPFRKLPPEEQDPRPAGGPTPADPDPPPGGVPGRGGCSSYQRLSKFAGLFRAPILNPGLRGTLKKRKTKCVWDLDPPKHPKKRGILGRKWPILTIFGGFLPKNGIFGHFWSILGPPRPPPDPPSRGG
jgi:hypothetical protein